MRYGCNVGRGYDSTILHRLANRYGFLLASKATQPCATQCGIVRNEYLLSYQYDLGVNMVIAIIILSWLLINSWIVIAVLGFEDKWGSNEWLGILISALFSPLVTLGIAQPISAMIEKQKKKKGKKK